MLNWLVRSTRIAHTWIPVSRPPMTPFSRLPSRLQPRRWSSHRQMPREGSSAYAPSLNEILSNESRFLSRLRLRLRFLLLGSSQHKRRFQIDEVAALFSWFSIGTFAFAVLGTTSLASLFLVLGGGLDHSDLVRKQLGDFVSKLSGFEVSILNVIPNWKDGTIEMRDVKVLLNSDTWKRRVRDAHKKENPSLSDVEIDALLDSTLNLNWTHWDLSIKSVNVSISLWRYFQGFGLVKDCKLSGLRGVVDRSHVVWDKEWVPSLREATASDFHFDEFVVEDALLTVRNPYGFRPFNLSIYRAHLPLFRQQWLLYDIMCADSIVGAYDNCLFSVHKWSSSPSSAQSDTHQQQPLLQQQDGSTANGTTKLETQQKRNLGSEMSHLKINNLPIDHFNTGVTGPFSWITSGTIDVDFHFVFPQHQDDVHLFTQIKQEFDSFKYIAMDRLEKIKERHHSYSSSMPLGISGGTQLLDERDSRLFGASGEGVEEDNSRSSSKLRSTLASLSAPKTVKNEKTGTEYIEKDDAESEEYKTMIETYSPRDYPSRYTSSKPSSSSSTELKLAENSTTVNQSGAAQLIFMHWAICLNDLRASVPLSTPEISYMSNALIRPVVGYMNSHRVRIPLTFEARTELARFDGSWDFFSAGIVDVVAEEIGRALTLLVLDERERTRHLKRIGLWSIQNATKNLMEVVDFVRGAEISQQSRAYI
ncbi:UNVERIFIED_CONTAM: Mitochondrial distribution and morphology protein 31, mitochondrial precursor [Siphonaria sp. JEL0065]|nr:Mitochondrial distribution and morphology protein 31, mitochondrial precursor [Siphonaria sp. JEL0065]